MKKFISILFIFAIILTLSGCSLDGVSFLYRDNDDTDGFSIFINRTSNCCFVGNYNCTEYVENIEITIPDEFEGIEIKRIGGYHGRGVPSPFSISLSDAYMNAPKGSKFDSVYSNDLESYNITEKYTIEDVVFVLNIGKNIEVIEYVDKDNYYPHINEDGNITFYHPVVSVNCSEDNKSFYSKEGKLYNKANDELIEAFAYKE